MILYTNFWTQYWRLTDRQTVDGRTDGRRTDGRGTDWQTVDGRTVEGRTDGRSTDKRTGGRRTYGWRTNRADGWQTNGLDVLTDRRAGGSRRLTDWPKLRADWLTLTVGGRLDGSTDGGAATDDLGSGTEAAVAIVSERGSGGFSGTAAEAGGIGSARESVAAARGLEAHQRGGVVMRRWVCGKGRQREQACAVAVADAERRVCRRTSPSSWAACYVLMRVREASKGTVASWSSVFSLLRRREGRVAEQGESKALY